MPEHYVIEVNIRKVTPAAIVGGSGRGDERHKEREVDEVTRVVTKAGSLRGAVDKAKGILDLELEED